MELHELKSPSPSGVSPGRGPPRPLPLSSPVTETFQPRTQNFLSPGRLKKPDLGRAQINFLNWPKKVAKIKTDGPARERHLNLTFRRRAETASVFRIGTGSHGRTGNENCLRFQPREATCMPKLNKSILPSPGRREGPGITGEV